MVGKTPATAAEKRKIILPKITKIGNEQEDEKIKSERNLLITLIEACLDDHRHIAPLYDRLLERRRKPSVVVTTADFSTLGPVNAKCYQDFLTSWVVTVSDFTIDDLMAARSKWSSNAVFILARLGLQYPASFRLTEECREQAFVTWMYTKRHQELGSLLQGLKAKAGFNPETGMVDLLKGGRYSMTYRQNKLVKLKYHGIPETEIDIDPVVTLISQKLEVQDIHSDLDAHFVRDPLPAESLMNFFTAGTGPWQAKVFKNGKVKDWKAYLEAERSAYDKKHKVVVNKTAAEEAKEKISKQKQALRKGQIEKAKETMKQKMKSEVGKRRYKATS